MNILDGKDWNNKFAFIATKSTQAIGSTKAFIVTILIILMWLVLGPFLHFSDTWQITINTISTLTTSVIVVLIQYSQNKDTKALHIKIDELIKASKEASNKYRGIENLSQEQLEQIKG